MPRWNHSSRIQPWNYLSVQLNRTSDHGDPDLFGLFWESHHVSTNNAG